MTWNIFYSTDLGAQQMRNTVDQLNLLLKQCLVDGGPPFSVTSLTFSGGRAYATTTAHNLSPGTVYPVERTITVQGAVESPYNATTLVSITSNTTFNYPVTGSPTTPATGTITAFTTPLGWTRPYSATNRAAFQQGAGSNAMFLDVNDSIGGYALVRGFETMSAVGAGSNPFPTIAQNPLATYLWHKSSAAVDRPWIIVGNSKYFALYTDFCGAGISTSGYARFHFGDAVSIVPGDAFNTMIHAGTNTSAYSDSGPSLANCPNVSILTPAAYMARLGTGVGTSLNHGMHSDGAKNTGSYWGSSTMNVYPTMSGSLMISPIMVHHSGGTRGILPGHYDILHNKPLSNFDYFNGIEDYVGKRFQCINMYSGGNPSLGQVAVQVSPW